MSAPLPRSQVFPKLYVGPHPHTCPSFDGVTLLVLCAHQHQDASAFRCRVHLCPLTDDNFGIVDGDRERATAAAGAIAGELREGGRVLVSCVAGQNRSSWVAGRAMLMLGCAPNNVVSALERERDMSNYFFKQDLLR